MSYCNWNNGVGFIVIELVFVLLYDQRSWVAKKYWTDVCRFLCTKSVFNADNVNIKKIMKEAYILFNGTLNTFYLSSDRSFMVDPLSYLQLYGIRHMVKDYPDSERGNPLPPHGLLFPISSKGSFICIIPETGYHIPWSLLHQS